MTFLYPLGLLGLIGVPIVIIIYILRSKFNELTVTSTYIWTLSEKFFKRRNPLSGITGLISLILQILTIILVSLAIARPIFTIPNSASEYCFVLDASGSMNYKDGGKTRFDEAKAYVKKTINDARLGSSFTLVTVDGEANVVYERLTEKKLATDMLAELECSDGTANMSAALSSAQKYFDANPSTLVYFVTDKDYEDHKNVKIVNLGLQSAENYAISDVFGALTGGKIEVEANVISYTSDAELTVELYLNGAKKPDTTKVVSVKAGEKTAVTLSAPAGSYDEFRVVIKNKDALMADNEFISYNKKSGDAFSILVVSETPFFFEAALDVLTDSVVDTVTPDEYTAQTGYGLYIFHSYTPDVLPDAAVWLVNSHKSVDDSGFGIRGSIELDEPAAIEKSASTSTQARKLLEGVDGRNIFISEYTKYSGLYTKFTTLFSYASNPLIMAGVNAHGNREVVFAFDLHTSDLALSSDFAPLMSNLLAYSCPDVVDRTDYYCGEEVNVNVTANMSSVKAIAPDGEETYLDTSTDIASFRLDKVGTYTIEILSGTEKKAYYIYSGAPEEESSPSSTEASFSLTGEQRFERTDGEYDPLVLLFILLAVVFAADWMVFCYEKYQLR